MPKGNTFREALEECIIYRGFPTSDDKHEKAHEFMYSLYQTSNIHIAYYDLMGRFPYHSSRGNEYIMVSYHYDANAI